MVQGVLFEELERDAAPELSEYDAFVEKFKPKKTTDDCYTPANVYAVADWCAVEYGLDRRTFVRPFYPGGDYEHFEYPAGCCVVDNPPFSILSQIVRFYLYRGIKFFLFAPSLTCFNKDEVCAIVSYCDITYTNGALVRTSFLTNLEDAAVRSAPSLYQVIKVANDINLRKRHRELPKYEYPAEVLTAAKVGLMSQYGIEFRVPRDKCTFIRAMDAQRGKNKSLFGGGFLHSTVTAKVRAAAQAAAAQTAAANIAAWAQTTAEEAAVKAAGAYVWRLSDRERAICDALDGGDAHGALFDNE